MTTERDLIERAAMRDREAFGKLYSQYIDKIYKYIYYKCSSVEEAEELTSQVFLKAWEAIGSFQWQGYSFGAWLYRIAHNQLIDHYRTHVQTLSLDSFHQYRGNEDTHGAVERVLASEQVRKALKHLTQDQQRVVILRFLEGYSVPEIAAIMDKDPAAIRALQHRALVALRPWLAEADSQLLPAELVQVRA